VPCLRLHFSAFPRSHKKSCYPLSQTTTCQTVHEIFKNVANASHTSMHVRQHCPRWMQSTGHNAELVYPCWAPFVITDCHVLENKASQTCDRKTPITRIHNKFDSGEGVAVVYQTTIRTKQHFYSYIEELLFLYITFH